MDSEFKALESAVQAVDGEIRQELLSPTAPDFLDIVKKVPKKDGAKLCVSLAYTLGTLYYTLLKAHGEPTKGHSISEELDRVKAKYVEVQQFVEDKPREPIKTKEGATVEETVRRRSLEMASSSDATTGILKAKVAKKVKMVKKAATKPPVGKKVHTKKKKK